MLSKAIVKAIQARSLKQLMHIDLQLLTNSINHFFIEKKLADELKQSVDMPL